VAFVLGNDAVVESSITIDICTILVSTKSCLEWDSLTAKANVRLLEVGADGKFVLSWVSFGATMRRQDLD
jgi:hypothetical protein